MHNVILIAWWLVALATFAALSWGPGTHLEFEHRVFRLRKQRLPSDVARTIEEHRQAWQYGHIAADIINFKAVGGPYSHCHRWGIVADMNALARTDVERAFVMGYLSHLAADTIAHNHFVPYHLARYARTKGMGHLYWEMNADRFVPEDRWRIVSELKKNRELTQLDELVNRSVAKKALSMATNKFIFNHVLLVSEREQWRRGVAHIHPIGNLRLKRGFLGLFQDAAVARILLALQPDGLRRLAHVDANGKAAQKRAMRLRRKVLHRLQPGRMRQEESAELAAPFLVGMHSPPPRELPEMQRSLFPG
jgi:hypothetical protein